MIYFIIFVSIIVISFIIIFIVKSIQKKHLKITQENSKMVKSLEKINEKFKFFSTVGEEIYFSPELKSKRSLEKFDIRRYVIDEINSNMSYYVNYFAKLDKNKTDYESYKKEYKSAEAYTSENDFKKLALSKIKYKAFNKYEKKLYNNMFKSAPQISVNASCHATYTSPSGRNHYWKDASFSYSDLKRFIVLSINSQKQRELEMEQKKRIQEEKRAKEKKLRELDKLEKELQEKEEAISKKEQEFIKATQGHIYSNDSQNASAGTPREINENVSPYIKLKKLKQQFDAGEISYEEYTNRKAEII